MAIMDVGLQIQTYQSIYETAIAAENVLRQKTFVDITSSFGLRSAPPTFPVMADALAWAMERQGVTWLAPT